MQPIRIVLCDDHRIVIDGLQRLLAEVPDIECVGTAQNGVEALFLLDHVQTDVLLTDLDMPEMDGAELVGRIQAREDRPKVIVLSMHEEPAMVERLMKSGADGYLVKSAGKDEVLLAIRNVHAGRKHFSSDLLASLMEERGKVQENSTLLAGLSEREVEVLAALAEGLGNKEIGERLFISPRTVDTHRTNLMHKLNLHNTAEIVLYAVRKKIIA